MGVNESSGLGANYTLVAGTSGLERGSRSVGCSLPSDSTSSSAVRFWQFLHLREHSNLKMDLGNPLNIPPPPKWRDHFLKNWVFFFFFQRACLNLLSSLKGSTVGVCGYLLRSDRNLETDINWYKQERLVIPDLSVQRIWTRHAQTMQTILSCLALAFQLFRQWSIHNKVLWGKKGVWVWFMDLCKFRELLNQKICGKHVKARREADSLVVLSLSPTRQTRRGPG